MAKRRTKMKPVGGFASLTIFPREVAPIYKTRIACQSAEGDNATIVALTALETSDYRALLRDAKAHRAAQAKKVRAKP